MKCGICYCNKNIVKTNCKHYFCKSCLLTWRNIKNNCPMCRTIISYTEDVVRSKTSNRQNNKNSIISPRVTRSMTKRSREANFYREFRRIVFSDNINEMTSHDEKTKMVNKVVKLCFQNYTLLHPNIYAMISEILDSDEYHIHNRGIFKQRLLEIKQFINYESTIPIIYQGNHEYVGEAVVAEVDDDSHVSQTTEII